MEGSIVPLTRLGSNWKESSLSEPATPPRTLAESPSHTGTSIKTCFHHSTRGHQQSLKKNVFFYRFSKKRWKFRFTITLDGKFYWVLGTSSPLPLTSSPSAHQVPAPRPRGVRGLPRPRLPHPDLRHLQPGHAAPHPVPTHLRRAADRRHGGVLHHVPGTTGWPSTV